MFGNLHLLLQALIVAFEKKGLNVAKGVNPRCVRQYLTTLVYLASFPGYHAWVHKSLGMRLVTIYCVVMSNSVLLSVYTCYSGYTAEFAAQLATTTYDSAFQSLKLSNSEKQVRMHSLKRSLASSFGWWCHHGCQYGYLQALISYDSAPS